MEQKDIASSKLYARLPDELMQDDMRESQLEARDIIDLVPIPKGTIARDAENFESNIRGRTLQLDAGIKEKRRRGKANRKSPGKVVIPKEHQKYSIYEPLAKLWKDYAVKAVGNSPLNAMGDRVVRMDLHGAEVEVIRSKDPGLIGIRGILVAETANTIMIVTKADRVLTVPKNVAVIKFHVGNCVVELMLPALAFRASERSVRKMKKRHMPII